MVHSIYPVEWFEIYVDRSVSQFFFLYIYINFFYSFYPLYELNFQKLICSWVSYLYNTYKLFTCQKLTKNNVFHDYPILLLITHLRIEFSKILISGCLRHNSYLYANFQPHPSSGLSYALIDALLVSLL